MGARWSPRVPKPRALVVEPLATALMVTADDTGATGLFAMRAATLIGNRSEDARSRWWLQGEP